MRTDDEVRTGELGVWLVATLVLGTVALIPILVDGRGGDAPTAFLWLALRSLVPGALAAVIVASRRGRAVIDELGLRVGGLAVAVGIGVWVGVLGLCVAAPVLSAAMGYHALDTEQFSGFRAALEQSAPTRMALRASAVHTLVAAQVGVAVAGPILNAPLAIGEELGWRGYLAGALRGRGRWVAAGGSAAGWGLWSAPLGAVGIGVDGGVVAGIVTWAVFGSLFGVVLAWARLRTDSVWPAVVGHGAFAGAATVHVLVSDAGSTGTTLTASVMGWPGWALMVLVIAALATVMPWRRVGGS